MLSYHIGRPHMDIEMKDKKQHFTNSRGETEKRITKKMAETMPLMSIKLSFQWKQWTKVWEKNSRVSLSC